MLDEQQDAPDDGADDTAAGGVSAEQLMGIPGPPSPDSAKMAGPKAAAEERARQAAEAGAAAARGETGDEA